MARTTPSIRWGHVLGLLKWIDGTPLFQHIEPYRARLFDLALDTFEPDGRPRFNLIVCGRGKKNWKTTDLVVAALFALVSESPAGHDSECYLLANDADQAGDDLSLAKKIVRANPELAHWLKLKVNSIERKDGRGFLEVLPAGDVVGQHGKSYRFVGYDEIHGYRNWDMLEAMQPDPHRLDAQQWITSYASLFHRPGVPLFDLIQQGKSRDGPSDAVRLVGGGLHVRHLTWRISRPSSARTRRWQVGATRTTSRSSSGACPRTSIGAST